jgi:hypothetical protein
MLENKLESFYSFSKVYYSIYNQVQENNSTVVHNEVLYSPSSPLRKY